MSADIELKWQWPAERKAEENMLVRVNSINKQSGGFLGIKKSPSLAESFPDPVVIDGVVINTDKSLDGKTIRLSAPKLEVENIKGGSYAVLGIVDDNICICVIPVANKDIDPSSIVCP